MKNSLLSLFFMKTTVYLHTMQKFPMYFLYFQLLLRTLRRKQLKTSQISSKKHLFLRTNFKKLLFSQKFVKHLF